MNQQQVTYSYIWAFMKKILHRIILFLMFLILPAVYMHANAQQFDKASYYEVMRNGSIEAIDQQSMILLASSDENKDAYTGALLMKKAGLIKGASKKLNVFKEGSKKLEARIEKENKNAELRFLRLMIQEHAPGILNYRSDINADARIVHNSFKNFPPAVQAAVLDYRKQSNTLQQLNF